MGKSRKPNRSYDNDKKDEGKVKSLQKSLKEKDKEISQLRSQVKTLETAFKKAAAYMSKESSDLTVEELIKASNKNHTLEEAKKQSKPKQAPAVKRPPTVEEIQQKREEARQNVLKWRKENLGNYEEE